MTVGLIYGFGVAAAVTYGRHPIRRALSVVFGVAAPCVVFFSPFEPTVVRFILGIAGAFATMNTFDLLRDDRGMSTRERIVYFLVPFDPALAKPVPRGLSMRDAILGTVWGGLMVVTLYLVDQHSPASGVARYAFRWPLGLVAFYSGFECVNATARNMCRLGGWEAPKLHDNPILSKSIQEFWGERWNLIVHRWMKRHFFRTWARRGGVMVGVMAAFVASTILHMFLMLAAGGWFLTAVWGVFFLLQGVLLVVERKIGVRKWSAPVARLWTIGIMLLSCPMFIEPMLQTTLGS